VQALRQLCRWPDEPHGPRRQMRRPLVLGRGQPAIRWRRAETCGCRGWPPSTMP
jgi:hypothetical protein